MKRDEDGCVQAQEKISGAHPQDQNYGGLNHMQFTKSVRILLANGEQKEVKSKPAADIVDMSRDGVPNVQVTDEGRTTTYVGCQFEITVEEQT